MDELTERNFKALAEGLKEQRTKNSDQDKLITSLQQALAGLQTQMTALQQSNALQQAQNFNGGPTNRG